MAVSNCILEIALPTPLRRTFDYLPPQACEADSLKTGSRIKVPFGRRELTGVLLGCKSTSELPFNKLKQAIAVLDEQPLFNPSILSLYQFASQYYQHSLGDIIFSSLPPQLREGQAARLPEETIFTLTELGANLTQDSLKHASQQYKIIEVLRAHPNGLTRTELSSQRAEAKALTALLAKGYIQKTVTERTKPLPSHPIHLALNDHQQQAVSTITANSQFVTYLLEGITGSGKTEVYLQCMDSILKKDKQTLILVPEIGLTPQTVARFQARFNVCISILHSGLNDTERSHAWLSATKGLAKIIIGTRSAILTPLPALGLIILDEEHDASFKQQSGFRYSARDLAVMRGKLENIPVILGTATPCLESIANVKQKRFVHLNLPTRAGNAVAPTINLVDVRNTALEEGLSPVVLEKMQQHLDRQGQILIFLNRRGYAPTLICHQCGWTSACIRCDARMTYHAEFEKLICHHCARMQKVDRRCGGCHSRELFLLGVGTQRLERVLHHYFPKSSITRIDRDSTRRKNAMAKMLASVYTGESNILIGTQMLAKGHHFPNVTMVVITDIDGGLFSADFKACERLGQLVIQVAGRAGRSDRPGEVYLQTHNPNHPLLLELVKSGYGRFADLLLKERKSAELPPYSHLVLFRAQASNAKYPHQFLSEVRALLEQHTAFTMMGPIPAFMAKKAGQFRAQLLIQAKKRAGLQKFLSEKLPDIEALPSARKVRWSIDVDPIDILS